MLKEITRLTLKQVNLPKVDVLHKRNPEVQPSAGCREPQPAMPGQTEDAELNTNIGRKIVLCRHQRQKYRCCVCGRIDTAGGAPKPLVPGGRYAPEVGGAVAVDKFAYHLPLERQVDRFAHQGVKLTNQTLWDQTVALHHVLLPVDVQLRTYLIAKPMLGADGSLWRVLEKGRSAKWWTWAFIGDDTVFYMLSPTRGKAAAAELLLGFSGILSVDGYAAYTALEAEYGAHASLFESLDDQVANDFTVVPCRAHARRGPTKAENKPPRGPRGAGPHREAPSRRGPGRGRRERDRRVSPRRTTASPRHALPPAGGHAAHLARRTDAQPQPPTRQGHPLRQQPVASMEPLPRPPAGADRQHAFRARHPRLGPRQEKSVRTPPRVGHPRRRPVLHRGRTLQTARHRPRRLHDRGRPPPDPDDVRTPHAWRHELLARLPPQ